MSAAVVGIPLEEVSQSCSERARAYRFTWDADKLCGRYFFTMRPSEEAESSVRISKDEAFAIFINGEGRMCVAITIIGAQGNHKIRRQICHTFASKETFVGWPNFAMCAFASPATVIVDPILEDVPPIIPISSGCSWSLTNYSTWCTLFERNEEITVNLDGWSLKLAPRGLTKAGENLVGPLLIISNPKLPEWTTIEVNINSKRRITNFNDFIPVESGTDLAIEVQPYALPVVQLCGKSATWTVPRDIFDSIGEVKSAPFTVVQCEFQLLVRKVNDDMRIFVLAPNAPPDMEVGFAISCGSFRVTKTYNFGCNRGIGYPRVCGWPSSGDIEIIFTVVMHPIPPVHFSGSRGGAIHAVEWKIPNAKEMASRLQFNDEVRSSFFTLLGTRWQLCLGLREAYNATSRACSNGSVALFLGSEVARSALLMMSLGSQDTVVNTLPMSLTWSPGQVWGFKNIASADTLLNLSHDGSLTVRLDIFAIPKDDYAVILPYCPIVRPWIRDSDNSSVDSGFVEERDCVKLDMPFTVPSASYPSTITTSKSSILVKEPEARASSAVVTAIPPFSAPSPSSSSRPSRSPSSPRQCVLWIARGLQKLALMSEKAAFFNVALIWIDSAVAKTRGAEDLIAMLEKDVEPVYKILGAIGEDDLSILVSDAVNARFGRSANAWDTQNWRRNKLCQRQRLASMSPLRFGAFSCHTSALEWITTSGPGFPCIVKPIEGSGSQFCALCKTPSDVISAFERGLHQCTAELSVNDSLLVEEYLQGTEYVVNSVSFGNSPRILEVWHKTQQHIGQYVLYDRQDLLRPEEVPPILNTATQEILSKLGVVYGASHLELMIVDRDGECVECVELNARTAGHASRTMPFDSQLPECEATRGTVPFGEEIRSANYSSGGSSGSRERIECDLFWRRFGVNQSSILLANLVYPDAVVPPVPSLPYITAVFLRSPGKGILQSEGIKKVCRLPTFYGFDRDLAEFHIGVCANENMLWPTSMDRVRNLKNTRLLTAEGRAEIRSLDVAESHVETKETVDLFTVPGVVLLRDAESRDAINRDYDQIRAWERDGTLYALEVTSKETPRAQQTTTVPTTPPRTQAPPKRHRRAKSRNPYKQRRCIQKWRPVGDTMPDPSSSDAFSPPRRKRREKPKRRETEQQEECMTNEAESPCAHSRLTVSSTEEGTQSSSTRSS